MQRRHQRQHSVRRRDDVSVGRDFEVHCRDDLVKVFIKKHTWILGNYAWQLDILHTNSNRSPKLVQRSETKQILLGTISNEALLVSSRNELTDFSIIVFRVNSSASQKSTQLKTLAWFQYMRCFPLGPIWLWSPKPYLTGSYQAPATFQMKGLNNQHVCHPLK